MNYGHDQARGPDRGTEPKCFAAAREWQRAIDVLEDEQLFDPAHSTPSAQASATVGQTMLSNNISN
jgi:hypothetical protein